MTPPTLEPIEDEGFSAVGSFEDRKLTVRLSGEADRRTNERLDAFLRAADQQAVAAGIKEVVVDFRTLAFMNSSNLTALVGWLRRLQEHPAEQRYTICFLHEPAVLWQIRSFRPLVAFAGGLLTIV
jgi:anti-anti-sigma factor